MDWLGVNMTHVYSAKNFTRLMLLLVIPCMNIHAENIEKKEKKIISSLQVQDLTEKPKRSRLKFRDGPVCMCSQGLSEKEIQAQKIFRFVK